jgi:glutamate racemase
MLPGKERRALRILITDSGLGGLSICAEFEKELRSAGQRRAIELLYVNAWPHPQWGYNDLPDLASRARVLDRALSRMAEYRPDLILIACNTLSVLYEMTEFSRNPPPTGDRRPVAAQISGDAIPCRHSGAGNHVPEPRPVPVRGIIDEGVALFEEALTRDPAGRLLLFGTRTTVESGEHIRRLAGRGIDPKRMSAAACHRLAAEIDEDPDSSVVVEMIGKCVSAALPEPQAGGTLYAGLVCTHYGYVRDAFRTALARRTGGNVEILDPDVRLVRRLTSEIAADGGPGADAAASEEAGITVQVVSKVELGEAKRRAIARRIAPVSPHTARALLDYAWTPNLF